MVRRIELKSPFARAVVPVTAGIGFFALLGLFMWGVAALSSNGDSSSLLANRTFSPGRATAYASSIAENGPIIFPDLLGTDGDKTIVLDHTGDDPKQGFAIYLAHPADRPVGCKVTQRPKSRVFTDCEGRILEPSQLAAPPAGVSPVVSKDGILDLIVTVAPATTAATNTAESTTAAATTAAATTAATTAPAASG